MEKPKKILIVCGEASGDLHAANLVKEIKKTLAGVSFFGLGGKKLRAEGVELHYDLTEIAVIGFWEVLKNLSRFRKVFRNILAEADKNKPDLAILVDYPGFNLRLAAELDKRGIPVIYYISPQVWAWGKNRLKSIRRHVSRMLVLFKFEEELYLRAEVPVSFVGHPLLEIACAGASPKEFFQRNGLEEGKITVSLLPGSREKEVKTLLPLMLEAAKNINKILLFIFYSSMEFFVFYI